MFALTPVLSLAIAAFVLSVAYEGEIYLQNLKGAFKKLMKPEFVEQSLGKEYLLTYYPENVEKAPQFFKDYDHQINQLLQFEHGTLDDNAIAQKKRIEKNLKDMERWFTKLLFSKEEPKSDYAKAVYLWLREPNKPQVESWQQSASYRGIAVQIAKGFSVLAGLFMGVGSTYLIVGALGSIPLLAAIPFGFWPLFVIPMAVIAGTAYGFLTYNSITDMINNDTLGKWLRKLRDSFSQGITLRNVFMAATTVCLVTLAVALTLCTAGTWWTVVNNTRPIFEWMQHIPGFVMGVINPLITGTSAIFFNVQNTAESLELLDEAMNAKQSLVSRLWSGIKDTASQLYTSENAAQWFNPFRLALKLTIMPLRILLFFGHLISIALTADRVPGIPQIAAALVGMISEGFEDAHYFVGHEHEHHHDVPSLRKERLSAGHSHSHDADIPTRLIKLLASPVYFMAAVWDWGFSRFNDSPLAFRSAWNKQWGVKEEDISNERVIDPSKSFAWQKEQSLLLIDRFKEQHLQPVVVNSAIARDKIAALETLQEDIRNTQDETSLRERLNRSNEVLNKHRLFASSGKTSTQAFIESLQQRVMPDFG